MDHMAYAHHHHLLLLLLLLVIIGLTTIFDKFDGVHAKLDAIFVFGDSIVDPGNNNYLPLGQAKANHLPNGIDFPTPNARKSTGRFTNGLTIPDMLVYKVGFKNFTPPYMDPSTHGRAILRGVNYASGGGGILNETGRAFIQRMSLDVQIGHFEKTKVELTQLLGSDAATTRFLSNSIFVMCIGANDFLNNYVNPIPDTADVLLAPSVFYDKLITTYRSQLIRLYDNGARKFVIENVPLLGCIPYLRAINFGTHGQCNERANRACGEFNGVLQSLIDELNAGLPGATFLYADGYNAQLHVLNNYQKYGFDNADKACCGAIGPKRGIINCQSFITACPDRDKYFFWDPYHPSQAGYQILADEFFEGSTYIYPMNIKQLFHL